MTILEMEKTALVDLRKRAKDLDVPRANRLKKEELMMRIRQAEAEKEGLEQVTEVKIKVGELQQIELDILEFALSQLKPSKFKHAKFSIEVAKAELKCRVCGQKWIFKKENN